MCEDISVLGLLEGKVLLGGETFSRAFCGILVDWFVSMEGTVKEDRHEHRSRDA